MLVRMSYQCIFLIKFFIFFFHFFNNASNVNQIENLNDVATNLFNKTVLNLYMEHHAPNHYWCQPRRFKFNMSTLEKYDIVHTIYGI